MSNTKSEIKNIIMDFSNENLNEEYTNKSLEILDKLEDANAEILGTSRTDMTKNLKEYQYLNNYEPLKKYWAKGRACFTISLMLFW